METLLSTIGNYVTEKLEKYFSISEKIAQGLNDPLQKKSFKL